MSANCIACELTDGRRPLPGGRVHSTEHWVVEHCVGPLGVGTLIAKPIRHCVSLSALTEDEARELGPVLHRVSRCVHELNHAGQVYVCLWSHAAWEAVHIHFVIQPAWREQSESFAFPGPTLQSQMFLANLPPEPALVESFCQRAREWFSKS